MPDVVPTDGRSPRRIIACGGRNYAGDVGRVLHEYANDVIVHGACPTGLDATVAKWCAENDVIQEPHPAKWSLYGKAAGPMRNQEMADAGADECLAWPGGRGTADMVARAEVAGIRVRRIPCQSRE